MIIKDFFIGHSRIIQDKIFHIPRRARLFFHILSALKPDIKLYNIHRLIQDSKN
jgi:hypothetical protein